MFYKTGMDDLHSFVLFTPQAFIECILLSARNIEINKIQFRFSSSLRSGLKVHKCFSTGGNIAPQGTVGNFWKHF